MNRDEIRSEIDYLDACLRDIADRGDATEQESFDAGLAERARLEQLFQRHAEIERLGSLPQNVEQPARTFETIRSADPMDVIEDRTASRTALADALTRAVENVVGEDSIEQVRTLAKRHGNDRGWVRNLVIRSSDVYASAFSKMATGNAALLNEEERASLAVGTNTAGGLLVPTFLDPTVMLTNAGTSNVVRGISRVVTLSSGNVWNGVTSAGVTASWDGELVEVSDDSPSFAAVSVPLYKAQAFVQASHEAFEDIAGLQSDVLMMFADARDRLEGAAHCTGSGSAQPKGIFTAITGGNQVVSTTAAVIGLVDLHTTYNALPVRFRPNSTWLMAPKYALAIKELGTAVSASFSGDLRDGTAGTLLGKPVIESDDAPTTQTTTVKDSEIMFGDFSNYLIIDKPGGVSIEFIPTLFNTANNLPDGRRGWLMHWRTGADAVVPGAFRQLVDKTSA